MENIEKCSGVNCPMQVGYDVANCQVKDCPFRTKPLNRYDLIRHFTIDQMAEIERLQSANDEKFRQWDMLAEKTKQHYTNLYEEAKDILKAKAYKEFVEKLKNKWFDEHYDSPDVDFDDFIDNLLKEMVGEEE